MSERKSIESISHGRGGAGNIGADDTPYADGDILLDGVAGDQGRRPYSSGRGGVANIGSPGLAAAKRNDKEVIPAEALRDEEDTNHHVGRGGQGNVHVAKEGGKAPPTRSADKLKAKLFGKKVKGEAA
ncbi:hypothetical protein VE04_08158 [Pseudogymnoascus sp. 24MN13]|nr:hypothetical protein VE04_08158 [Pseudogymnoascus sp. 24MN13]